MVVHAAHVSREPTLRLATKLRMTGAIVLFLVITGVLDEVGGRFRDQQLGETFRSASASMLPTLKIGDRYFSDPTAYHDEGPKRGDIVIFKVARDRSSIFAADRRPDLPTEDFVKRVVGVPGDTVELNCCDAEGQRPGRDGPADQPEP